MKWRQFVYSNKSLDNFINKIGDTFGKDCILAYGDWSIQTQQKYCMPSMNRGLRKLIHKKYQTISID